MVNGFAILDFGAPELVIILAIVLVLFGGKKLPELSRSLGESMKELRGGFAEANGAKQDLQKHANAIKQSLSITPTQPSSSEDKLV